MIKKIIVGVDGSEDSFEAYRSSCEVAEFLNASIEVIYVIDTRKTEIPYIYSSTFNDISYEKIYIPPDPEMTAFYAKMKDDLRKFGQNCLDKCGSISCYPEIEKSMKLVDGIPQDVIIELSENPNTLILIGRHGENGKFHTSVLGSTAEEVIRRSKSPVLITGKAVRSLKRIAYYHTVGGSARNAVEFLVGNFNRSDVQLYVIHQKKDEIPAEILDSFSGGISSIPADNESSLLKVIEANNFDVVISGAHGRHRIADFVMGSTAVHLMRKSSIPLFIVN